MENNLRFITLLTEGWHESIQNSIITGMYFPIKRINTNLQKIIDIGIKDESKRLVHIAMGDMRSVLGFYEELFLKSLYIKKFDEFDEQEEPQSSTSEDVENMLEDMKKVSPKSDSKKKKSSIEDMKERFHTGIVVVKERIDSLVTDMKGGIITEAKTFVLINEIQNMIEFVYVSMRVAKNISPDMEGIKKAIENNVVPLMAEKHIAKQYFPRAFKRTMGKSFQQSLDLDPKQGDVFTV